MFAASLSHIPRPKRGGKSRTQKPASVYAAPGETKTQWSNVLQPLGVFALALAMRLFYLSQIETTPLFYHLVGDALRYHEWARRIAAGDWWGEGVFYQAPLYPYFLGLLQIIFGDDLWSIRVVQILLGAVSCCLLVWAGRSFFSQKIGMAAGLTVALYGPAIFFDGLIQKSVLEFFFVSLLLFLFGITRGGPRGIRWLAIGAAMGALGLARENTLIWLFVVPIWIWFYFGERPARVRLGWIAIFFAGLTLVLFPVGLRNLKVGGEFTLTTSQLGPNFFIGNNPAADGSYAPLRTGRGDPEYERQDATELAERAIGRSLSASEVSRYWVSRSWQYIRSQPLDWLRLTGRKWMILWNARELEDAEDFYIYQNWSPLLSLLSSVNHFGILAPLAALGFALTWKERQKLWLLYFLLGTLAFSLALFYVFGRYRFSLVPLLALFAGAGISESWSLYRKAGFRPVVVVAVALLPALVLVNWPIGGWPGPSAAGYNNLAVILVQQGKMNEAMESYRQALNSDPAYAVAHYNLGNLLAQEGRLEEAMRHYQQALRIDPGYAEAHNNLGNILIIQGESTAAIQHFRHAIRLAPNEPQAHFNLGVALGLEGRLEEAMASYQRAIEIKPDYVEAHLNLAVILADQGRSDRAITHLREALRIQPEFAEAHEGLGRLLTLQGKRGEAIQHMEKARRIMESRSRRQAPR